MAVPPVPEAEKGHEIMSAIEPWLLAIIANQAGREPYEIADGAKLADDLKLDSLDEMEMVVAIEDAKGISIPADDWLPQGATVADMNAAVLRIIADGDA